LADIAAKYKGDKGAQARLEAKTRNGGAGSFGTMPMPATARSQRWRHQGMVAWILPEESCAIRQRSRCEPAYRRRGSPPRAAIICGKFPPPLANSYEDGSFVGSIMADNTTSFEVETFRKRSVKVAV
jgi:hypothetical protein